MPCLGRSVWEATGAAAPGKPDGLPAGQEFRICKMCSLELTLSKFPIDSRTGRVKGAQCSSCSASGESLQRVLRQRWKSQYRERYALLKSKPDMLRSLIVNLAKDPSSRQKRSLKISAVDLETEELHASRKKRRRVRAPLTWENFNEMFQEPAHGGYTPEQNEARWQQLLQQPSTKRDRDGITAGVGGQLRLWVKTGEKEESESESAEMRRHVKRHSAKKPFKGDEASEFVHGDVLLSEEGGMVMADQTAADALCTHIEKALGLIAADDTSVTERGGAPSSSSGVTAPAPSVPSSSMPTMPQAKAQAAALAKWQRDKDFKIAEARRCWQDDLDDLSSALQSTMEVVTAVRTDVLGGTERQTMRQT